MDIFIKYKKSWIALVVISILAGTGFTLLFSPSTFSVDKDTVYTRNSYGSNYGNHTDLTYGYFQGMEHHTINLKKSEVLSISYKFKVEKGSLKIILARDNDTQIVDLTKATTNPYQYTANKDEVLDLQIVGDKTKGNYNIDWDIQ